MTATQYLTALLVRGAAQYYHPNIVVAQPPDPPYYRLIVTTGLYVYMHAHPL